VRRLAMTFIFMWHTYVYSKEDVTSAVWHLCEEASHDFLLLVDQSMISRHLQ